MKKCLSVMLILCLLFAGFTAAEIKAPSENHGSVNTEFGGFIVPVPDYYEYYKDVSNDTFQVYVGMEENMSNGAVLVFLHSDSTRTDVFELTNGALFEQIKLKLLDELVAAIDDEARRISTQTLTIPNMLAQTAYYMSGEALFCAAALYNESGKEMLFTLFGPTGAVAYDGYYTDYNEMLEGISLKGAAPAPKITVKEGGSQAASPAVSPEVKEFWDSYEAFVDEYIDFMEAYAKNPSDLSLLSKLYDYIGRLTELEKKGDAYTDAKQYSGADLAYSLEVSARVLQKLSGALGDFYGSLK